MLMTVRSATMVRPKSTSGRGIVFKHHPKPLIAVAFACIVYLIFTHQLVAVSLGGDNKSEAGEAAIWVAAFLCGFSERFASDIIAKLEPSESTGQKE